MYEEDIVAEINRETMRMIAEYGHQVIGVFPTGPEDGVPFSYTVGRTAKGRPELVITGPLDPRVAGTLLNDAAEMDDANPLEPGELSGLISGYPVRLIEADPYAAEMFQALRFYEGGDLTVRALQVVWPDPDGRFPGEPGYEYPPEVQPIHSAT